MKPAKLRKKIVQCGEPAHQQALRAKLNAEPGPHVIPPHSMASGGYPSARTTAIHRDDKEPTCAIRIISQRVWRSTRPGAGHSKAVRRAVAAGVAMMLPEVANAQATSERDVEIKTPDGTC